MIINYRIAVLSDIHSNLPALQAVLDDAADRGITEIVNLGDSLYGPIDPAGTADILMSMSATSCTVSGNQDRFILHPSPECEVSASYQFTKQRLKPEHLEWLESLPSTLEAFGFAFLFHGTPEQDDAYMFYNVTENGVFLKPVEELSRILSPYKQNVFLCGHDHVPRTVYLPDGKLIINPGSVGLPAYSDDLPFFHTMETFTPHARYAVLIETDNGWVVENIAVPYNWDRTAETAKRNGREDWYNWLKTGRHEGKT